VSLRQRLDAVAGPDPTARERVGSQPALVYEATQHSRTCNPFEVGVWLTSPLSDLLLRSRRC
jgi:hypothetical protein